MMTMRMLSGARLAERPATKNIWNSDLSVCSIPEITTLQRNGATGFFRHGAEQWATPRPGAAFYREAVTACTSFTTGNRVANASSVATRAKVAV